jgi:hypothetical protein
MNINFYRNPRIQSEKIIEVKLFLKIITYLDLKQTEYESVDWVHLAQDRDQRRGLVKTESEGFTSSDRFPYLKPGPHAWLTYGLLTGEASTSETSVNLYQTTRCNISEDSHLRAYLYFGSSWGIQSQLK